MACTVQLVVKAKDNDQAIEQATNRLKNGDLAEYFDFPTAEE